MFPPLAAYLSSEFTWYCGLVKRSTESSRKRLLVPVALTVVTLGAVATIGGAIAGLATSAGCGDDSPKVDAGTDGMPDTPIV